MLYRSRLLIVVGLLILAGCLPRSNSTPAGQVFAVQSNVTDTPMNAGQVIVQAAVTDTSTPSSAIGPIGPLDVTTIPPTITETPIPTTTVTTFPSFFEGFPDEYKSIQLPQQIIDILNNNGFVVPLPASPGSLSEELTLVAYNFDPSRFDFRRIIHFPPELGNEYIAVPVSQDYFKKHFGIDQDFNKGVLVGLIYDKNGTYRGVRDLYEIWAFENYVYLNGLLFKNAVQLTQANNEYYWRIQDSSSDLPLAVFIKNGCWLCWRADTRCGCLVCRN